MNKNSPILSGIPLRKIGAFLCAAALSTAVLAGCGGESSADTNDSGTSSKQKSGDSKKSSNDGLPEDFPDDVPLPEFTSAKKLGNPAGAGDSWNFLLMLKSPTETPLEDYAAQLADAGYTVEDGPGGSKEAEGPKWGIYFHSAMTNTLSVAVMDQ